MSEYEIQVRNEQDQVLLSSNNHVGLEHEVYLHVQREYQKGDSIHIIPKENRKGEFVWLSLDETMQRSLVYITGEVIYQIPFEQKRTNHSPKAFCGDSHLIFMKKAKKFEWNSYRNLAFNACDQHSIKHLYPHAFANVETRGEADFAAENAINGITFHTSHGNWPYGSWGINKRADATFTLDFGREVIIDTILFYERADFPHDNYWIQATFTFSDESKKTIEIPKSMEPYKIVMEPIITKTITLSNLIMSEGISEFPALAQIEVYGKETV